MKTALALGSFDGVHIAHRKVLDLPCDHKKTAVTFLEPPKMFFEGKSELITTYSDKVEILKGLGFDEIVSLDFERVKNTEPQDFLNYLYEKYNPDNLFKKRNEIKEEIQEQANTVSMVEYKEPLIKRIINAIKGFFRR